MAIESNSKRMVFTSALIGLGLATAILSLLGAIHRIFGIQYAMPISVALDAYQFMVTWTIGLLEPIANLVGREIGSILHLDFQLAPIWKNLFMATGLYFFREIQVARSSGQNGTAIILFLNGFTVSFLISIGVSSLKCTEQFGCSFLIYFTPIAGILFYELVASAWKASRFFSAHQEGTFYQRISMRYYYSIRRFVVSIFFSSFFFFLLNFVYSTMPPQQLAWLTVFVFLVGLGLEWMRVGYAEMRRRRASGESSVTFLSVNTARVGTSMVFVLAASVMFVLLFRVV